jgi:alpha-amylase
MLWLYLSPVNKSILIFMKKLSLLILLQVWVYAAAFCQADQTIDGHPAWIMQGNVYEVNVRQYTKEGTFKAFGKHLDRLKQMGVQTLWFMPINPISKVARKGSLGSYYAVANYTAINPEFGTLKDFKKLVAEAHEMGMKVIIDWVPNHTGADHIWIKKHPDFYVKDKTGKPAVAFDWADTRQLNYKNVVMQDSMINAMKFWLVNANIDGFRCDVAWNVPGAFWKRCITYLRTGRSLFFLAEGDKTYLHPSGFDATYPWEMFHTMGLVAKGARPATSLDSIKAKYDKEYPKNALELYFTSNHDENSWNKADYGVFPAASHAPFAVFTQTMPHSIPLIYSGQEEPVLRPIKFFDKDPIKFGKYDREKFYKTLLNLRKYNQALSADASFRKVSVGDNKALYAYVREKGGKKVFVILNLSAREQTIIVNDNSLLGKPFNVFGKQDEPLTNKPWKIEPWGYVVYTY